ncbi:MAG: GxxExxY protein [Armatimonadota bacterium]
MDGQGQDGVAPLLRENLISYQVIGAAVEVHRQLGPGLLESAYELALCRELEMRGLQCIRQKELPIAYKGVDLGCAYRLDIVVGELVVVEIKAVEQLIPLHKAQLLTYLRLTGYRLGLLINFNVPVLTKGVKRVVLGLPDDSSAESSARSASLR